MRYDWIVSNPPVHCGQPDDFTVLQVTNRRCPYFTRGTLRGVCTRACVGGSVGGDGCCCRGCCCGGGRRGYVVVAVADADTWRAPASASQWRPVDRRSGAGAPAGYSHAILSAKYLGELQVPVGRLLALGGRFGWVRAEPSGDGRFVVWSAGRKSAGSETAARDSAAAAARAAIAEGRVERGRKKRKCSAVA